MSVYLRKCIDIAPTAVIRLDLPAFDYRVLRMQPWWPALRSTTSWLRLWADWPSVQPDETLPPGAGFDPSGGFNGAGSLAALDGQIKAAGDDGMQVVLLPYRYPKWTNGTAHLVDNSLDDFNFEPWDRFARYSGYLDRLANTTNAPSPKALRYRLPLDGHGPDSHWGRYVEFLWDRYVTHAGTYGRVAAFETVNEPNLQLWPQRSPFASDVLSERWGFDGTELTVTEPVAEMMATMDTIARRHDRAALCLAASTSDSDVITVPRSTTTAHHSEFAATDHVFVEPLLAALRARGFQGGDHWIWSYHNYSDVERAQSHVTYLRQALIQGGWNGRQLDGGPEVWCTEGGCRPPSTNTRFRTALGRALTATEQLDYQAKVLTESLSRHHYAKGVGTGVGMLTQYTTYADGFNSGVLESFISGGAPRPALAAWSAVPEYVGAPQLQRADWRPQA
jgi:hypothetical protein